MKFHIPERLEHAIEKAHHVVRGAEFASHCSYLSLVAVGSHSYSYAAGAMLLTVLLGEMLHWMLGTVEVAA